MRGLPSPYRLAITNQKGGVGKTTTAINLAAALAELGIAVLLIDLDPQGNASTGFGILPAHRGYTTYDLLAGKSAEASHAITPMRNLTVIPAGADLAGAELELVDQPSRETALARGVGAWITEREPAVIFYDCPPSLGLLTLNALCAADAVLVPLQCEFFALEGLANLLGTLDRVRGRMNPRLELNGIVLTMFDRRNNLSEQVAADVRSFLGSKVFETVIPRNVRISEAPSHGVPVTRYDPKSQGALAYVRLANEFMARLGLQHAAVA